MGDRQREEIDILSFRDNAIYQISTQLFFYARLLSAQNPLLLAKSSFSHCLKPIHHNLEILPSISVSLFPALRVSASEGVAVLCSLERVGLFVFAHVEKRLRGKKKER